MATDSTTDNIVNLNQGVRLTNAAINVIKKIFQSVLIIFFNYIVELEKFFNKV
jgi:hypothetical protein